MVTAAANKVVRVVQVESCQVPCQERSSDARSDVLVVSFLLKIVTVTLDLRADLRVKGHQRGRG